VSDANVSDVAELMPLATAIGEAWAQAFVVDLRSNEREVVGGWPGTLREARRLVLARLGASNSTVINTDALQLLARTAYDAARRSWQAISEPDPEA
jgi:hypothetical protein